MVDDTGKLIWQANYQAWGKVHTQMYWDSTIGSYQESAHDTVQLEYLQPIRFQGQHFDSETGLHHNGFRYYDPDMGMFTSRDPIGLMGGNNVFAYAPNPTGWIDPLGLNNWGMLQNYGNSKGMQAAMAKAQAQAEKGATSPINPVPTKCSLRNTTNMTNVGASASIFAGAGISAGAGKSCNAEGEENVCYSVSICGTAGAEASATGSFGQSITNSASSKGLGFSGAGCVAGKGAAGVGASIRGCQNSDGSQTANAVVGGGSVSGEGCYAVTYCH